MPRRGQANDDAPADAELIYAISHGKSEKAFRMLYRRHAPALYAFALRLTCRELDAQDLAQETWLTAVVRLDGFRGTSKFRTWLFGIAINIDRNASRYAKRRRTSSLDDERRQQEPNRTSTDRAAYLLGVNIDLTAALQKLAPGYRRVLVLHDVEGYGHHDIAELLGIAVGTSKSQLHRARRIVRRFLSQLEIHQAQVKGDE